MRDAEMPSLRSLRSGAGVVGVCSGGRDDDDGGGSILSVAVPVQRPDAGEPLCGSASRRGAQSA